MEWQTNRVLQDPVRSRASGSRQRALQQRDAPRRSRAWIDTRFRRGNNSEIGELPTGCGSDERQRSGNKLRIFIFVTFAISDRKCLSDRIPSSPTFRS
jgi:hypothetical protein